ncbi:hypothetical protein PIB30_073925 [Stylosanthes scabra]|uniref:Uncharacterized protein n=1 Tax=Stylosanthes scabra TaxID=79078 RepID=A0ABU6YNI6_9FABA|nr:hypothetical protein [Stylosanthes scabra]
MGGVFFAPLSGCACISAFGRHGVFSFALTSCMLLLLKRVLCLSALIRVESSLILSKRPFWLDDEGTPFPWVYWNAEIAYSKIWKSRAVLTALCKMKEAERAGPRSILPSSKAQMTAFGASASVPVAQASTPATSVPPAPSSGAVKARKKPLVV